MISRGRAVEPAGANADGHRIDTGHRHLVTPFLERCVDRGTSATRTSVRYRMLDRTGVRCQASSPRIVEGVRVSLAVTLLVRRPDAVADAPARLPRPSRRRRPVERLAERSATLGRGHRVALERRRDPRPDEPGPGDGPLAVAAAQRRRPPRSPGAAARRRSRTARAARATARCDAVTPMSRTRMPAQLGTSELERGRPDRLGQVGRLRERALAGDRPEAAVADLHGDRAGSQTGRAEPPGDPVGHRQERPLEHLADRSCRRRRCARGRSTWPDPRRRPGRGRCRGLARGARPPCLPSRRTSRSIGSAARSPIVDDAVLAQRGRRSAGPTPHSRPTASGARNAASSPGATTTSPSGLREVRRDLRHELGRWPTPTETVSPTSSWTASLMRRAIVSPSPNSAREPVTSRNASSIDTGSTCEVNRRRIAMTWLADGARTSRRRPAGRPRPDTARPPSASASPSGPRTGGPRSWPSTTTPRASGLAAPTMTGRPRSSGRSRCSTAAKKASRSTCRMVRTGRRRSRAVSSRSRASHPVARVAHRARPAGHRGPRPLRAVPDAAGTVRPWRRARRSGRDAPARAARDPRRSDAGGRARRRRRWRGPGARPLAHARPAGRSRRGGPGRRTTRARRSAPGLAPGWRLVGLGPPRRPLGHRAVRRPGDPLGAALAGRGAAPAGWAVGRARVPLERLADPHRDRHPVRLRGQLPAPEHALRRTAPELPLPVRPDAGRDGRPGHGPDRRAAPPLARSVAGRGAEHLGVRAPARDRAGDRDARHLPVPLRRRHRLGHDGRARSIARTTSSRPSSTCPTTRRPRRTSTSASSTRI